MNQFYAILTPGKKTELQVSVMTLGDELDRPTFLGGHEDPV